MVILERPPSESIPNAPGSYQFKDANGRVIYVGKAKSLRSRVSSYFQRTSALHPRTAQMVASAASVDWIQVENDVEALMLEYNLIKRHRPRFNVRLVDDKSYPYLALTLDHEWPRARVMRGKKRKGTKYFGPFAHAYAIRDTLDHLLRTFPIRTCTDAKLERHVKLKRPCLLYHIEKCAGPCIGEVTPDQYAKLVDELADFLDGNTDEVLQGLQAEMRRAADRLDFERAAKLRDRLATVNKAIERQQMVAAESENFDVIGLAQDELEAAVFVFIVRRGRVLGRRSFIVDKVEPLSDAELIDKVLEGLYDDPPVQGLPKQVLVPQLPSDIELYQDWLNLLRGANTMIRVPARGDKKALLATVNQNASEAFQRHKLKRATDHNSRSRALNELQERLALQVAPLRIECYDMSHLQGSNYVGSMVVFEDGLARKSDYRRFKLREVDHNNDYEAMREVLTRRLKNFLRERDEDNRAIKPPVNPSVKPVGANGDQQDETRREVSTNAKFRYPPQLLVVDGGKGQLGVAVEVLDSLGLSDEIEVCALAKRFEHVFRPGYSEPFELPRQSEGLYLLQRIRDESHRFAIDYHRSLRTKSMKKSVLDGIHGLGPARKKRLINEFGSVKAVRAASLDALKELSWLPDQVADEVYHHLHLTRARQTR